LDAARWAAGECLTLVTAQGWLTTWTEVLVACQALTPAGASAMPLWVQTNDGHKELVDAEVRFSARVK
jgi:hypothetical protein